MMTQIEMDTMRAIISFSKEYRRQNSFVKLITIQKTFATTNFISAGDVQNVCFKEVLLRVSDISYIKETDEDEMVVYLNNDKRFFISKKEYEEKLANLII